MEIYVIEGNTLDEVEQLLDELMKQWEPAPPKGVVNVDMDGVLYDFTDAMRVEFEMRGWEGASEWPDPKTWNFHDSWPVSEEDVLEVMHAGILNGDIFRNGRPIEGAYNGLTVLKDLGYTIRIVTQKTFADPQVTAKARTSTLYWLNEMDMPYDEIVFCGPDKTDFFADVVIDDKPDATLWEQPNTALNILFHQAWNVHDVKSNDMRLWRAPGWGGVIEAVLWHEEQEGAA